MQIHSMIDPLVRNITLFLKLLDMKITKVSLGVLLCTEIQQKLNERKSAKLKVHMLS